MISKNIAAKIYNCYNEIEQAEKMIEELKKSIDENGELTIRDIWGNQKGLELHLPLPTGGARIKHVPFELAIDVINSHIAKQKSALADLKETCMFELTYTNPENTQS